MTEKREPKQRIHCAANCGRVVGPSVIICDRCSKRLEREMGLR